MRSDLFTRLALLAAAACVPALCALIFLQSSRFAEQNAANAQSAQHMAELVSGDLATIVEGARQMMLSVSQYPSVTAFEPACREALTTLDELLPSYELMSVVDEDGAIICSSVEQQSGMADALQRQQNATALAHGSFETGVFTPAIGRGDPMLMFSQPFIGAGSRRGVINVGLSLKWLNEHFQNFRRPAGSTLLIADRNGTKLVQLPGGPERVGRSVSRERLGLLNAAEPGTVRLGDSDGLIRDVGYVPAPVTPLGLFVCFGLSVPALTAVIEGREATAWQALGAGALLSAMLLLLFWWHFIRKPAEALLHAAQAWSQGDFAQRLPAVSSENTIMGRLFAAFNAMAASLGRQQVQRDDLQQTLETRVSERTADLQRSRDRLQVALGEQAKSEASLRQAQKLQAVGQLAGGIAHDFNNLLTAVIGALELLRARLAADDARSLRLLDNALHAADRGGRLVAQLLAFSRRQRLLPVPTDLNQVILGMLSLLTTSLGRTIRIETGLARALWPALVDPHQVESAILNLALNARDAMAAGGTLRISTNNTTLPRLGQQLDDDDVADRAQDDASAEADYVMIRVSDTGTGMSADVLARVFEPFFTTKQAGTKPGSGSGLGLSQVHGLAAQSGGDLRIESQPGLGTTVTLLLPRAEAPARPMPEERLPGRTGEPRLRVLVADDDQDVRGLTGEMLRELGHVAVLVADAPAALEALGREDAVDVLLADYAMPGLNGLELIARAERTWPSLSSILVTGHADMEAPDLTEGRAVLRKPYTLAVLSQALDGLLKKHPMPPVL